MPRTRRIESAGALDHVMSRGNRRQGIFLDDVDRQGFLKTLAGGVCDGAKPRANGSLLRSLGWRKEELARQPLIA
jgi:hypothetical protein